MRLFAEDEDIETEPAPSLGLRQVAGAELSPVLGRDGQVQGVPTTQGQRGTACECRCLGEGRRAHVRNLQHVLLELPIRLIGPDAVGGGESPGSFLQRQRGGNLGRHPVRDGGSPAA